MLAYQTVTTVIKVVLGGVKERLAYQKHEIWDIADYVYHLINVMVFGEMVASRVLSTLSVRDGKNGYEVV
jgi:phosphoribosyl-ATP pyrophosphohydrolase